MKRVLSIVVVVIVAGSFSKILFISNGAAVLCTMIATALVITIMDGDINIARYGTPWIAGRRKQPALYWTYLFGLVLCLIIVLLAAPKRWAHGRYEKSIPKVEDLSGSIR